MKKIKFTLVIVGLLCLNNLYLSNAQFGGVTAPKDSQEIVSETDDTTPTESCASLRAELEVLKANKKDKMDKINEASREIIELQSQKKECEYILDYVCHAHNMYIDRQISNLQSKIDLWNQMLNMINEQIIALLEKLLEMGCTPKKVEVAIN